MSENAAKPKKVRRRYSDDFRATALAMLAANGGNVDRTARVLGVPRKTLEMWQKGQNEPPAELCQIKKREVMEGIESAIWKLVGVEIKDFSEINLRDWGIALGITVDKYLAIKGFPNNQNNPPNGVNVNVNLNANGQPLPTYDPRRLTPAEASQFAKLADRMRGQADVVYPPQPGDDDYDPGIEPPAIANGAPHE